MYIYIYYITIILYYKNYFTAMSANICIFLLYCENSHVTFIRNTLSYGRDYQVSDVWILTENGQLHRNLRSTQR